MFFQSRTFQTSLLEERNRFEKLEQQAKTDKLTGLLNKAAFMEEMEKIIHRGDGNTALVFFDLDYFKKVNDTLGHLAGDKLLKTVAGRMREIFREEDLPGRFGGDEFYILVPDTTYEGIYKEMDDLLAAMRIECSCQGKSAGVSASIGVVYLEKERTAGCECLLELADAAAYEAKQKGRNQYVIKVFQ